MSGCGEPLVVCSLAGCKICSWVEGLRLEEEQGIGFGALTSDMRR